MARKEANKLTTEELQAIAAHNVQITECQTQVLAVLRRCGPLSTAQIAQELGFSREVPDGFDDGQIRLRRLTPEYCLLLEAISGLQERPRPVLSVAVDHSQPLAGRYAYRLYPVSRGDDLERLGVVSAIKYPVPLIDADDEAHLRNKLQGLQKMPAIRSR